MKAMRMFATFTQLYRENEELRARLDALQPVDEVLPFGPTDRARHLAAARLEVLAVLLVAGIAPHDDGLA